MRLGGEGGGEILPSRDTLVDHTLTFSCASAFMSVSVLSNCCFRASFPCSSYGFVADASWLWSWSWSCRPLLSPPLLIVSTNVGSTTASLNKDILMLSEPIDDFRRDNFRSACCCCCCGRWRRVLMVCAAANQAASASPVMRAPGHISYRGWKVGQRLRGYERGC